MNKRIWVVMGLVVLLAFSVGILGSGDEKSLTTIGISQLVEHPALNAVREGIKDILEENGYEEEEDVEFIFRNAQNDMSNAKSIAQTFKSQNVDIVITIATNTSVAAKQVLDETPILVTAVTNFEIAGLVDSMEAYENPGDNENITGYSDQIPVKSQFELIREMVPNVEKVGNIYNAGEPNSSFLTELAEDACDEMGIELIKATVSNTSEVSQAAQSLRGRVDAIWISTDNTVVSGLGPVAQVAKKEKIPVVVADPTSVGKGALVGYGFDYYDHGRLAGQKLIQLLEGEKPNEIPIGIGAPEDQKLVLDLDQAEEMGFEFPSSVVEKANAIRYLGEMWKKQ